MAGSVRDLGAELEVPVGAVLEGGYALVGAGALGGRDDAGAQRAGQAGDRSGPDVPEASAARARLAERWPSLA